MMMNMEIKCRKEKKALLTKTSIRKGDLESYSADSKESLGSHSYEKAIAL